MESEAKFAALSKAATVSRETFEDLLAYEALLQKWNPRINLVAKSTLADAWQRHIVDSAQVWPLAPENPQVWADLGSGGGFPGLVLAVMAKELSPETTFILIESDARKCSFMNAVIRDLHPNARVITSRIEAVADIQADVISGRALAVLDLLLDYSKNLRHEKTNHLFLKGKTGSEEISAAQVNWRFNHSETRSITSDEGVILRISDVARINRD